MKLSVNFKTISYYFYVLIFQIIYIGSYYFYLNVDYNTIGFAIVHSIFASIFMVWSINKLEKMLSSRFISYNYFINFILSLYFELSSIKYAYNHYTGFIDDNLYRLIFNIIIMFLIVIITLITDKIITIYKYNINLEKLILYFKSNSLFLFMLTIIYIIINIMLLNTNFLENIVIQIMVIQFFMTFIIIINIINIDKLISKINIILILITFIYRSSITGKRNEIIVPITIIVVYLLIFNKIKIKNVKKIIPYMGIVYIFMSLAIFKVSGRFDLTSNYMKSYLGNRFDVTDMSLTYFENSLDKSINVNLLKDSIINSVPSAFINDKKERYTNEYAKANVRVGLKYDVDYGDTIISMVSQIWPGYGAILILLVFYIINNFIIVIFIKLDKLGTLIMLLNLSQILNVEQTCDSYFAEIVYIIIISIVSYFLYKIFKFKTKFKLK